ncbi:MAG: hypothetical protein P8X74_01345 [Reinekea sp.]|jgi:type II secretory pathway pseudopilin PulG
MKNQRGIALIAAIFLVVVIGSALAILASLSIRTQQQTNQSLLKMRAQFAASAAIDAQVQKLIEEDSSGCNEGSPISTAMTIQAYNDFNVTVRCSFQRYNRPSQEVRVYNMTAVAEYGAPDQADYVWTELNASAEL